MKINKTRYWLGTHEEDLSFDLNPRRANTLSRQKFIYDENLMDLMEKYEHATDIFYDYD